MAQPGWNPGNSPYNLINDVDGPLNDSSVVQLQAGVQLDGAVAFSLNKGWDYRNSDAQNADVYHFNQIGILAGPATYNSQPNNGGIVTLELHIVFIEGGDPSGYVADNIWATATVDLTNAIPGQFYWSAPSATPQVVNGYINNPPGSPSNIFYYYVAVTSPVNYALYARRACTVNDGAIWGIYNLGAWPPIDNTHMYAFGGVDLNLVNYQDLSTGALATTATLSGQPRRRGELGALPGQTPKVGLYPQIQMGGQIKRAGELGRSNFTVQPILANPGGLSGGPLWKPAPLCTG